MVNDKIKFILLNLYLFLMFKNSLIYNLQWLNNKIFWIL